MNIFNLYFYIISTPSTCTFPLVLILKMFYVCFSLVAFHRFQNPVACVANWPVFRKVSDDFFKLLDHYNFGLTIRRFLFNPPRHDHYVPSIGPEYQVLVKFVAKPADGNRLSTAMGACKSSFPD